MTELEKRVDRLVKIEGGIHEIVQGGQSHGLPDLVHGNYKPVIRHHR